MTGFQPYLLILMRNDMESMTPGRAAAQASHATSDFTNQMESLLSHTQIEYKKWKESTTQSFGTTIVVGVDEDQMNLYTDYSRDAYCCGIIKDPTYPIRDGKTTHYVKVDTCAWIFINSPYPISDNPNLFSELKQLPLF